MEHIQGRVVVKQAVGKGGSGTYKGGGGSGTYVLRGRGVLGHIKGKGGIGTYKGGGGGGVITCLNYHVCFY